MGFPSGTVVKKSACQCRRRKRQFLGWEDPLEKEMATHSSILAWKIPWTEEPGRLQSTGSHRVGHDFTFTSLCDDISFIQFHSCACGCPGLPTSFVEETILSSLCILGSFVVKSIDHICVGLFLCSLFCSIEL